MGLTIKLDRIEINLSDIEAGQIDVVVVYKVRGPASAGSVFSILTAAWFTGAIVMEEPSTHHITAVSQLGGDKPHYDRIVLVRPFGVIGRSAHAIYRGGCRNIVPDHRIENVLREKSWFRHSEVRILPPQPASLVSQVNYEKLQEMPGVSRHSPPLTPSLCLRTARECVIPAAGLRRLFLVSRF
jgi:hypothetical protein